MMMAEEIAKELGVKLDIKDMKFDGLLGVLKSGNVDMVVAGMSPIEERKKGVNFTDISYNGEHVILVKEQSKNKYKSIDDLKNTKIAVQKASLQENIAKDIAIEIEALEDTEMLVSDERELLKALENDTFGMMENLINQMLKKHLINIFHHGYSKKGYLLAVLLLHSDNSGNIDKEFFNYELFNLSRSQFFATISELKKDFIIVKKSRGFEINRKEAEKFLELETY